MELNPSLIKSTIEDLLVDTDLPNEIKTFGGNVLVLKEFKKHFSVFFVNTLLFRVVELKTTLCFEFRNAYKDFFNKDIGIDSQGWVTVRHNNLEGLRTYENELLRILSFEFIRVHGEAFGCCSSYMKCSEKKQCVKTDFLVSLACQYRVNLLHNRIFYGVNRNI